MTAHPPQRANDQGGHTHSSLPLTQAQLGIWVGSQLYPRTSAYNIAEYVELTGEIHPQLLATQIAAAVADTDALNYVIDPDTAVEGAAPQQVYRPRTCAVPIIDLTDHHDPQAVAWQKMHTDATTPYPITGPNLFYHCLFKISPHTWWWYHRVHHVLLDGFGMTLLEQQVAERYTAAVAGKMYHPSPSQRLADVVHQETTDSPQAGKESQLVWSAYLKDRPEPPTISGRQAKIGTHVVRGHSVLSSTVMAQLATAGERARASWADALVGAWAAYLHKISGESQVCTAIPYMARVGRAALTVPCMVLNAFPLWFEVLEQTTLCDLAQAARSDMARLRPHALYRYEQMRRDVRLVNADRNVFGPSINIMPFTHKTFAGITPTVVNVAAGFVEDTALHVYYRGAGRDVVIALDANPEVLTDHQAQGHADRFAQFVATLATNPTTAICSAPVCLPSDTAQLAKNGAGQQREPTTATMWQLLTAVAQRTLDAVAVVGDAVRTVHHPLRPGALSESALRPSALPTTGSTAKSQPHTDVVLTPHTSWTFAELTDRCEQLATRLHAAGVEAGSVVAMALPPLADCVTVAFAAFRLGAAITALDADHPVARVRQVLAVAAPTVVVCCGDHVPDAVQAAHVAGIPIVDLTTPWPTRPQTTGAPCPALGDAPTDTLAVAVLTFTSGTTGAAKAVEVTHQNLVNFCLHNAHQYCDPATRSILDDRLDVARLTAAVTASWSFDTVWEGPSVLLAGGCLHVVPETTRRTAAAVVDYVRAHSIDFLDVTPTFAVELLNHGLVAAGEHHPAVVSLGGEAVPEYLWRTAREHPEVEWLNAYGPSECTVDVAWARLRDHAKPVVDRPVWGTHLAVVSPGGLRAAPDARGELWVAGTPVTRGYRDAPEATAAAFVTTNIDQGCTCVQNRSPEVGNTCQGCQRPRGLRRWYRTGDRAAMSADGVCTLLGRQDGQVKVGGFRVETGEVESALLRHEQVAQCAVLVRDVAGRASLVAYLVITGKEPIEDVKASVRVALAQHVPYYMIPSFLLQVTRLPRTVSGKLDVAALPHPKTNGAKTTSGRLPHSDQEGTRVSTVFSENDFTAVDLALLAQCDQACQVFSQELDHMMGPDDNFFAAGGHSLSAAAAAAALTQIWGSPVTLRDIFTYPTARALTGAVASVDHANQVAGVAKNAPAEANTAVMPSRSARPKQEAANVSGQLAPWLADTRLPEGFPAASPLTDTIGGVLVTGATGFVGAHIVADLLRTTTYQITCLVRATDDTEARQRLYQALQSRQLPVIPDRLHALAADAQTAHWGLTNTQWAELVQQRLRVVHCAAQVHHLHAYPALRATTVGGTLGMLHLAAESGTRLHYISTINTAEVSSSGVAAQALLAASAVPPNGYVASKWAAEMLCVQARQRAVAVTVHRPGRLSNATKTGVGNADDALWQVMRGMVLVGCCPDPGDAVVDIHPVDAFAREVVALTDWACPQDVYHHVAPEPVPLRAIHDAVRQAGFALPTVDPVQWQTALRQAEEMTARGGDHSLSVVAEHLLTASQVAAVVSSAPELVHQLVADLAECGVQRTVMSNIFLNRSVEFWRGSGFFTASSQ